LRRGWQAPRFTQLPEKVAAATLSRMSAAPSGELQWKRYLAYPTRGRKPPPRSRTSRNAASPRQATTAPGHTPSPANTRALVAAIADALRRASANQQHGEGQSTYEPILQRRLDMMADVFSWWQRTTNEEHIAIMRLVIDQERLEAKLADATRDRADA
jgi:hypothetical protein